MNYLAHLHLASLAESSLLGNLLADFVRGNPAGEYDPAVVAGIMMHRRVDVLTDNLPQVRACRAYFSEEHRRVAPITLDVVWDHFLARHWQQLEPSLSLPSFTQQAQSQILPHLPLTPPRFQNLNGYIWPERWLERYAELPFIGNVLAGMASRRPRLAALAGSFADVERNYHQLETQFWQFYPQMMQQAKDKQL
ncbi:MULTISPECIES: ACP phosphodiesterase [Serratia]|jgi:acyl carrier protein phosphodiesterase|uniref:ACP phosphodiesterase n=1 Tax=Serratia TaxID=613 RepID=UPI001021AA88|nr:MULTISPECIES: ACP phosphodiesterase [Serratia]MCS4267489.1 acyl carrier protein phosphodiesterase [Serratia sp. BIGb0163]RYM60809.1 ACP phosphodiesterase [Serratia proteamaculans]CAI1007844.1 acyl carrier protein phosphodiesterase [Serratia quinivorans]CAI1738709.1 acyl carrier protein phosphodiesterase [Serratia quinivorans]